MRLQHKENTRFSEVFIRVGAFALLLLFSKQSEVAGITMKVNFLLRFVQVTPDGSKQFLLLLLKAQTTHIYFIERLDWFVPRMTWNESQLKFRLNQWPSTFLFNRQRFESIPVFLVIFRQSKNLFLIVATAIQQCWMSKHPFGFSKHKSKGNSCFSWCVLDLYFYRLNWNCICNRYMRSGKKRKVFFLFPK